MTMTFQAKVKNSAIAIPDVYKRFVADKTFVTVSFVEKKKQITKESFKPFLDTSNWKFNREEANER